MMASVLDDIIQTQQNCPKQSPKTNDLDRSYKYFTSNLRPKLSIEAYLDRLASYLHISDSCFIMALIYIDRLTEANPAIKIDNFSIHRLCATSVILAMKFNDDVILHQNQYVARVVGINSKELCLLEYKFMQMIDFALFVHPSVFKKYYEYLIMNQFDFNDDQLDDKTIIKHFLRKKYINLGICSCHEPIHANTETLTTGKLARARRGLKQRKSKEGSVTKKGKH